MVVPIAGGLATAVAFLSVVTGVFAVHMLRLVKSESRLKPWKILLIMLVLFVVEEILGALKFFGIYQSPFLTHIIPSLILGLLIYALVLEILIARTK